MVDRRTPPKTAKKDDTFKPLAELMRPASLEDYVGQEEAVGEKTLLRRLLDGPVPSLILWGPPGCGKVSSLIYRSKIESSTYNPL